MKTEVQSGKTITVTRATTASIAAGTLTPIPLASAKFFGVAATTLASTGNSGAFYTEGVFSLPKLAEGITQGTQLYFNGAAVGATRTGPLAVGVAWETATTGATTLPVKINFNLPNATGAV